MHVRCDNQCKTGSDRENILGQSILFECMSICVLSPAHESEMRGYLDYVLIVKKTYLIDFVQIQPQYIRLDGLIVEFGGGGFFETFLEGSVDHIIYRDYILNRRFFIYCSLAYTSVQGTLPVIYIFLANSRYIPLNGWHPSVELNADMFTHARAHASTTYTGARMHAHTYAREKPPPPHPTCTHHTHTHTWGIQWPLEPRRWRRGR